MTDAFAAEAYNVLDLEISPEDELFDEAVMCNVSDDLLASKGREEKKSPSPAYSETKVENTSTDSVKTESYVKADSFTKQGRYHCYVAGMTWWTTDQDLLQEFRELGVNDVVEIVFHMNRTNGQSKGFADVTCASDASIKILMNQLAGKCLNEQVLHVYAFTRANLDKLDASTRKLSTPSANDKPAGISPAVPVAEKSPQFLGTVNLSAPRPPVAAPLVGFPQQQPAFFGAPTQAPQVHINPLFYGNQNSAVGWAKINECEMRKVVERNQAIGSSALSRAESYANEKDYRSAVETIQMAVSLIGQSSVAYEPEFVQLIALLNEKYRKYQEMREARRHSKEGRSDGRRTESRRSDTRTYSHRSSRSSCRSRSPNERTRSPRNRHRHR